MSPWICISFCVKIWPLVQHSEHLDSYNRLFCWLDGSSKILFLCEHRGKNDLQCIDVRRMILSLLFASIKLLM